MSGNKQQYSIDTLTFKSHTMSEDKVRQVFANYGKVRNVTEYNTRFFVQFETPGEAEMAYAALRRIYRVTFAHKRTNAHPKRNFRGDGVSIKFGRPASPQRKNYEVHTLESRNSSLREELETALTRKKLGVSLTLPSESESLDNPPSADMNPKKSNKRKKSKSPMAGTSKMADTENDMSSSMSSGNFDDTSEGASGGERASGNDDEDLPSLKHSVILANLPERYTLDDVYYLVEEVKPTAFSEMDYSVKLKVKFCEVFLSDPADVDYLKQKLNDFVICGQQLTVLEPSEILGEIRWKA